MSLTRRELLAGGAVGAGLVALGDVTPLFAARPAIAAPSGFGPPVPDPAGILDLPAGFSYSVVSRKGDPMSDGGLTPGGHDGTAAFPAPRGRGVRLVQNHEIGSSSSNPTLAEPNLTYDPKAKGGTTTLVLDRHDQRLSEYVSLAGTWSNCAGGATPWKTWLTCEETETKAGPTADRDHGFVFEVDPIDPGNNVNPIPLTALGRFAHEAVVVDPHRGDLYLTEDASSPNGLVYRLVPNDRTQEYGALRNGGALYAMACSRRGVHVPDLSVFSEPGTRLQVRWVPVPDPLAATVSTRVQLANNQVTRSRKYEGAWWGRSRVDTQGPGSTERAHIVASFARLSDGSLGEHDGQVWAYDPERRTLTLEVRFALNPDPGSEQPDGPDNITVTPYGGLMLAEDGNGVQHLIAIDREGAARVFARNRLDLAEFTGVCFSPDGRTMFANLQDAGLCFAIKGPFGRF
jgi:secreted PhoX family phosphatase